MKIDYDWLKTFSVFVESANINEAARTLAISQPSVSVQLRSLEQLMGRPLFAFRGKKKVLTPFGRKLYEEISPRLKGLDSSILKVEREKDDLSGIELRVAGRKEILEALSSELVFVGRIQFINAGHDEAFRLLSENKADIAIARGTPPSDQFVRKQVLKNSTHLIVHRKFVSQRASLETFSSLDFLSETPALAYHRRLPFLKEWAKASEYPVERLQLKILLDDWSAIVRMVESGLGFSIVPTQFISHSKDVICVPIPESIIPAVRIYAFYHQDLRSWLPIGEVFRLKS